MKRIKKYLGGSYFRLPSLSSEFQTGASYVTNVPYINTLLQQYITSTGNFSAPIPTSNKVKDNTLKDTISNIGSSIIGKASDAVSDKIFGDSELGRNLGTIFSSGLNSVGDTVLNNAIKKAALTDGLTKNLGSSVGGAVAGLGANYLGRGITSILGNNAASRFLGLSASTVGGTIGGKILSSGTKNLFSGPGSINPIGLGMSAVGAGLSAATGPSKEYNGTYGSTTKALDTVYDALLAGIGLAPGGQIISGALALNKGLSNLFGSTDGMTSTDAILGSAFMPAPIKWLNMLGSSKTGTFNKLSWLNTLKTSNFMQNAFGDLEDKFSKAREEAGKTYGTFSQGAKKRALNNIDFSNFAWNKILNMADQNEYQNIRSSDMASINNLRYALWILGGFSPLARGKNGMKIFNNSINHNLGLRLLSGAALIDNKQMILSALNGTKIKKKGVKSGINVDYYDPNNVMSVVANNPNKTVVLDELTIKPNAHQRLGYYMKNAPAADIDKVMLGTLALGSAPIAALAAIPSVSTLGDYIAGTKLVNVGNKVITNPYVSSAIESAFAGHGLNHVVNEGINGWGDAATTAMELTPLGKLAKPIYKTVNPYINFAYNKLPWTYRIPENPNMAYRRMGPLERDWIMEGNELSTRETNALTEAEEETARRAALKKGKRFLLFKAGSEHGGRKQFAKGQPWKGTTVTHGEEQVLAIPGKGLPWVSGRHYYGPQGKSFEVGDISFEETPFGSHIDLLTKKGYSGVNPSLLDGSVIYSPYKIFGRNFGYKKLYPKNATRTPTITAENVSSMTPKQWATAARDAAYKKAVESGNRPEALRLLEQAYLNSGIPKTDITVTPDGHAVGWYHGSEWGNHTVFDSSAMNATIGGASANGKIKGNFLTTDVPSAMRYAGSNKYSSANVPEYTSPQTFSEKIKNLFGVYKPRRLYPAERVGEYAPKPERLFDTKGRPPVEHLNKVDNVVYPLYVNPGKNIMRLDFQGKPWSRSPVEFPNNFYLKRWIRDDKAKTYREEIIPFDNYESAFEAWKRDPINVKHADTSLSNEPFDEGIRSIEGFNSAPRYENVRLVEERIPNTTNGAVQTAAKNDNSSVLIKNVIDSNGGPNGVHYAIDDFVTLKPNQQKIADITYDDNGELIPLSQRFNWIKMDNRYSWLPWFLGGSTAATLYNKSK